MSPTKGDRRVIVPGAGPVRGDRRIVQGVAEFYTGRSWIKYPGSFAELIEHAITCGWGFDDGMPIRYRNMLENHEIVSQPYIRILIGRESGSIPYSDEKSPGIQFHLLICMQKISWGKPDGYVKTSETGTWEPIEGIQAVRKTMARNRVIPENRYASHNC